MPSQKAHSLLGWLTKVGGDDEDSDQLCADCYDIRESKEVLVGRDVQRCRIVVNHPSISNHHLKIYSIIYDDETRDVFIYAQDLSMNGSYWIFRRGSVWEKSLIGRGNAILLSAGEKIMLCDGTCFIFNVATANRPVGLTPYVDYVQQIEIDSFKNLYRLTDRQLGAGAFGRVLMAIDCFRSRQVACKIVSLREHRRAEKKDLATKLWREVNLLKDISHPNIIHVERVFYTEHNLYIIQNLIAGGDLRSYLDQMDQTLADIDASMIIYQVLQALKHLHELKIAHRDLKPENVLMSSPAVDARVILTDFGQSIRAPRTRMHSWVGTADYVAPEVQGLNPYVDQAGYTVSADMWSVGVLTTTLFLGKSYFHTSQDSTIREDSTTAILEAACKCDLGALDHGAIWQGIEEQAKDFIKRLLVLEESTRATVAQALVHPWFIAGDGGKSIRERYQIIIKGWMPSRAAQDFQENLKSFMAVRKELADSQAMPPPPKPKSTADQRRPLQLTLNKLNASPYFSSPAIEATGHVVENVKRPFSEVDEGEKDLVGPLKEKEARSGRRVTSREHDDDVASRPGFKNSIAMVKLHGDEIGESGSQHLIAEQAPHSTPEDDERDLYLKVGGERRGFRSARSFGCAVAERKRMKLL